MLHVNSSATMRNTSLGPVAYGIQSRVSIASNGDIPYIIIPYSCPQYCQCSTRNRGKVIQWSMVGWSLSKYLSQRM